MSHLLPREWGWGNTLTFESSGLPHNCFEVWSLYRVICFYPSTVVPDTEKEQEWTPATGPLLALKEEDQLLVRRLSRHVLNGEGERLGLLREAPEQSLYWVSQSLGPSVPNGFLHLTSIPVWPTWDM